MPTPRAGQVTIGTDHLNPMRGKGEPQLRKLHALTLVAVVAGATAAVAVAATITGPSSSQSPYVIRSSPGTVVKSILTVGDSVNAKADGVTPYRMVGIPDGLGAFDNGDGTFSVLMNHELRTTVGVTRDHGAKGSFVSKWTIAKDDLQVLKGEDLIKDVFVWSGGAYVQADGNPDAAIAAKGVFNRLCSADLPGARAFYNPASGKGYAGRIFMNGEESGPEGRAFAHVVDGPDAGRSYELPYLGKFSWENSVTHPNAGDKTIVVGFDDATPGQVYVYVGDKRSTGNAAERAGLGGGKLYGVKVTGFPTETDTVFPGANTPFTLADLGYVATKTGAVLDAESKTALVTDFQRPEDGAWDPNDLNTFYFATTRDTAFPSRLWRVSFADAATPGLGGTITPVLDGTEGHQMLDNLTVDDRRRVLLQEDPGGDRLNGKSYLAKVWVYDIASDKLTEVAHHDPMRFDEDLATSSFLTGNEESSGIIPVFDILGTGWYLADVQAHYGTDTETVEGGQMFAIHVPPGKKFAK